MESVFYKLSPLEIEERKRLSRLPLRIAQLQDLEVGFETFYDSQVIDFPKRPHWSNADTKLTLEEREFNAFQAWKAKLYQKYSVKDLSYFEQNLQVWRQLWRVIELSDIILLVVDARHPILHFPPALYDYVTIEMGKKLVLVLNKIDLIDGKTLEGWKIYFKERFPGLILAGFSCYPKECFRQDDMGIGKISFIILKDEMKKRSKRKFKRYFKAVGVTDILELCRTIHLDSKSKIDWDELIKKVKDRAISFEEKERLLNMQKDDPELFLGRSRHRQKMNYNSSESEDDDDQDEGMESFTEIIADHSLVTLGTIGHPNVGKSSLINGILGRKAVSVSKTPGHTKHFQTIHIADKIRLCDCPGLGD